MILALDPGPMLLECLAAVDPHAGDVEVIVVDNGSKDGVVAQASSLYPQIRVVRNETNLGFAPGANQGAALATGRYLLFLNTDALVSREGLKELVAVAEEDEVAAIWQPVVLTPEGDVETAGEFFTWTGFFVRDRRLPRLDAQPSAAFIGTAACMLIRRTTFEELGGFPADYFAYMEDLDLCWRARLAGWEVRVVPSVRVVHSKQQTSRVVFAAHEFRYLSYRNRLRSILANSSIATLVRVLPVFLVVSLSTAVVLVLSGRWQRALAVLRALAWPVVNPRSVAAQRREAQRVRMLPDRAVLRRDLRVPFISRDAWRLFSEYRAG